KGHGVPNRNLPLSVRGSRLVMSRAGMRGRKMKICEASDADHDGIWRIFHEVVANGDTYAFDPGMSREDALAYWFARGTHAYVARQESVGNGVVVARKSTASPTVIQGQDIVGTYI